MDILGIFRAYNVPFNDPCDENYRGVCHCSPDLILENIVSSQINEVCGVSYPAGTSLVDMLLESCGSSDDDWRFSNGGTYMDPVYRMGNVSIGGNFNTHSLRVDGTVQFNASGSTFEHSTNFLLRSALGGFLDLVRPSAVSGDQIGKLRFKSGTNEAYINATHRGTNSTELSLGNTVPCLTVLPTGRIKLDQYNSSDTLVNLVGMDSASVLTRHPVTGSPTTGSVIGFNGSGLSWLTTSILAQNGITYGTHVELGGTLIKNTDIVNPSYRFTVGNFSTTQSYAQIVQTNTTEGQVTLTAGLGTLKSVVLVDKNQARLINQTGTTETAFLTISDTNAVLHYGGKGLTINSLAVVLDGVSVYQNDGAAIADTNLPVNGLFRVANSKYLHIK
jgi:hypothetical protein